MVYMSLSTHFLTATAIMIVTFYQKRSFWGYRSLMPSNVVITRSNIVRYGLKNCRNWSRISIICQIHIKHPYLALTGKLQYIPRNMHTVFALLCFVVVIHWLIFPYPSGLLHWHCGNLTIAPVPAKQPWWIWINTSCGFIMNDCITTTKQSITKPCAYFLGYTLWAVFC